MLLLLRGILVQTLIQVRKASRTSGIPLFPIKNCSASQLVRALHSLLGLQPSNTPMASEPNPEIELSAEMAKGMYAEETAGLFQ